MKQELIDAMFTGVHDEELKKRIIHRVDSVFAKNKDVTQETIFIAVINELLRNNVVLNHEIDFLRKL